jgi:hypothetical protein
MHDPPPIIRQMPAPNHRRLRANAKILHAANSSFPSLPSVHLLSRVFAALASLRLKSETDSRQLSC